MRCSHTKQMQSISVLLWIHLPFQLLTFLYWLKSHIHLFLLHTWDHTHPRVYSREVTVKPTSLCLVYQSTWTTPLKCNDMTIHDWSGPIHIPIPNSYVIYALNTPLYYFEIKNCRSFYRLRSNQQAIPVWAMLKMCLSKIVPYTLDKPTRKMCGSLTWWLICDLKH